MKISIVPFGPEHEAGATAFNRRMRDGNAPTAFLLPTRAEPPFRSGSVTRSHYVAVDEDGEVRGGMLCLDHPALVAGTTERAINIQSPLSEGIINPAFTFVGPQLIKYALRLSPYTFVVGMGNAAAPLPRLLKAMGWKIRTVPFFFYMVRPSRCARHLAPLRSTRARRLAAAVAAATGAAALAGRIVHRPARTARRAASRFDVQPIGSWSAWADGVWDAFSSGVSFGVRRTTDVLPFFYPFSGKAPAVWAITRDGAVEGWFSLLITRMSGNPYFGSLVVATLCDCVGTPDAVQAGVLHAVEQARAQGADLVITNQQHQVVRERCAAAGWRSGPSNYLVATSGALNGTYDESSAYVTRRDGDGLTNLTAR